MNRSTLLFWAKFFLLVFTLPATVSAEDLLKDGTNDWRQRAEARRFFAEEEAFYRKEKANFTILEGEGILLFRELRSEELRVQADSEEVAKALSGKKAQPEADGFRDCIECPRMVWLPRGRFRMGSPPTEKDRSDDEGPVPYPVEINYDLAVSTHEITVKQFEAFVEASGHDAGNRCMVWVKAGGWKERNGYNWRRNGFKSMADSAVTCVNWYDARAYVNWLRRHTGRPYRLLTEAEWEYAARGGTRSAYWWGPLYQQNRANAANQRAQPVAVGSYPPNPFGLYDTTGGVWEWLADCAASKAYLQHKRYPAMRGTYKSKTCYRVLRGGSWNSNPKRLRSAYRNWLEPQKRSNYRGFRVAWSRSGQRNR